MDRTNGIVYLVGAGPGDPGLITLRGIECLRQADVVVYDNLANPELLNYAQPTAEIVYAGKKADQHTKSQDEINEILLDRASRGLTVVRLKGGDPFLFGRGGEEAAWMIQHGIRWEVVPGVTSAIAVPAYAGIPVTHRSVNGSLHIVTGHENFEGIGADVDWGVLAKSRGTLVFLMGVKNLGMISRELIFHGMSADTPVAMVQWGTTADQKTVISTLEKVEVDAAEAGIKPPALGVVGNVVNLREKLQWFEKRPLHQVRVAVTRPRNENDTLTSYLRALGAEVAQTPTLQVVPVEPRQEHLDLLDELGAGAFDWLVLTSGNGVRQFYRLLLESGKDARRLANCRIAVIGARTAEALHTYGIVADYIAEDSRQEGLAEGLVEMQPHRLLLARAEDARPILEQRLADAGTETRVLPLYRTIPDPTGIERLNNLLTRHKATVVTFTSARTFEVFAEATEDVCEALKGAATAVIGPVTRAALERAGVAVTIESPSADMESLAKAIAAWHGSMKQETGSPDASR